MEKRLKFSGKEETNNYLKKGDIAFSVLRGIIRPPIYQITQTQWCVFTIGCEFNNPEGWYNYMNSNRDKFVDQVMV